MKLYRFIFASFLVGLLTTAAVADTRYISDMLVVNLRSNTTANHVILERLPSNTPVTFLGQEGDFFRVRTPSGTEGFVSRQFVTTQQPKEMIIEELQARIENLQSDYATLQQRMENLQQSDSDQPARNDLILQLEETRTNFNDITQRYDQLREASADIIKIYEDNQILEEQNHRLSREVEVLREENISFHRSNMIQWFLAGAGVFFGGWLIGKVSRQKPRGFSR